MNTVKKLFRTTKTLVKVTEGLFPANGYGSVIIKSEFSKLQKKKLTTAYNKEQITIGLSV